jgi:hypothetical protein
MYGVAATLFSLLTGNAPDKMGRPHFRWPPQGEASLYAEQHEEWLRIHRIMLRATEENPANRFLTYTAFIATLEGGGEKQGSVTASDAGSAVGTSDRAGRQFGSSRLFTLGAFALALISLLGTVGLLNSGFVDAYVPFAAIAIPFVGLLLSLIGIRSRLRDLNLAALLMNAILLAIALYSNWPLLQQAPTVQESSPLPHPSPGSLTEAEKADYKATATLAEVYFDQKNYQSALDLVNQLTATYPVAAKNSIYSTLRARCLFALGRKEEAHAELRKSLSDMPLDTGSFGDRMQLWESLDDLEGAEAEATRAIKEERPITLYYLLRGKIRLLRQNFAGVEEDIHAASTLDNDPARANMPDLIRAGCAEISPAYADYLAKNGINLSEKPAIEAGVWAGFDSVIHHYQLAAQDFAKKRNELKKEADGIFAALAKGSGSIEELKKQLSALAALTAKAKATGAQSDAAYQDFLKEAEPSKKAATEADNSPDGWKTARSYDDKFAVLNNELLSISGWIGQDSSDWFSEMDRVVQKYYDASAKRYKAVLDKLSKSDADDDKAKITEAQNKMFQEQEELNALSKSMESNP